MYVCMYGWMEGFTLGVSYNLSINKTIYSISNVVRIQGFLSVLGSDHLRDPMSNLLLVFDVAC